MTIRKPALALLAALLGASLAFADGGGGGGGGGGGDVSTTDPEFAQAVERIRTERYDEAIRLLQSYAARAPDDASAHNWLGYAYRKSGQLDAAFMHYNRALALDPKHRGAHEYVGEAYLMVGNLAKAEEHLKILDRLCWLPCSQHADLKRAIADYKANGNKFVAAPR